MDAAGAGPAPAWERRYSEYIIEVPRESLRAADVISLATALDCKAAGVRPRKAARRAQGLTEVLVGCAVPHRAVTATYRVDFTAAYGSRVPRFKKDYFEMVAPKEVGSPAWETARKRLHREFEADGARWVDGELELPAALWAEFAVTARTCLKK